SPSGPSYGCDWPNGCRPRVVLGAARASALRLESSRRGGRDGPPCRRFPQGLPTPVAEGETGRRILQGQRSFRVARAGAALIVEERGVRRVPSDLNPFAAGQKVTFPHFLRADQAPVSEGDLIVHVRTLEDHVLHLSGESIRHLTRGGTEFEAFVRHEEDDLLSGHE